MNKAVQVCLCIASARAMQNDTLSRAGEELVVSNHLFAIDRKCPRIVRCTMGDSGFGDHIERYVYCVRRAIVLNGTLVISQNSFVHPHGVRKGHSGYSDYLSAAKLIGIRFVVPPPVRDVGSRDVDNTPLRCNTSAKVNLASGRAKWRNFAPGLLPIPATVRAAIQSDSARTQCKTKYPSTMSRPGLATILLHVRIGDICLNCDRPGYFQRVLRSVWTRMVLQPNNTQIIFESENELPRLRAAFPEAQFRQSNLTFALCSFLSADVLIATGSSFPIAAAQFAMSGKPVVFEEMPKGMRKVAPKNAKSFFDWAYPRNRHTYTSAVYYLYDSHHLIDGSLG